jgi:hypothetical protein
MTKTLSIVSSPLPPGSTDLLLHGKIPYGAKPLNNTTFVQWQNWRTPKKIFFCHVKSTFRQQNH